MRRISRCVAAAVTAALVAAAPGTSRATGWIDEDGVVHFDSPPGASRAKAAPRVQLYATRWCPACQKAREWFRTRSVAFEEYDIEEDASASARKQEIDGSRTIPVVVIDGEVIRGFSPKRFEAALAKRRPQRRR